ncbi:glycoside hydrolase 15 [mine drainage metagenome]|uniref:Glycoside hydrolase 15 n=1 Tax=mine drainage metagenome TaxID=410659 RepID=T0Z6R5_9ZZZZ
MLATRTLPDKSELSSVSERAVHYLISQVEENGYISAAKDYWWYKPHWIRDSSWIAISLIRFARYYSGINSKLAQEALQSADKIINFNVSVVRNRTGSMQKAIDTPYESPEFMRLSHRIPARVGREGTLYFGDGINDTGENDTTRSWLMQYDNIPLITLSIKERLSAFGSTESIRNFLSTNLETMLKYVGKTYIAECSNAWEVRTDMLHAYDIAAAHAFFRAAEYFADTGITNITKSNIKEIETGIYRHNENGEIKCAGPAEFLHDLFIKDSRLYANKRPNLSSPETNLGFDAEEIFIFTEFGLSGNLLGDGIEENTISAIKNELFSGHELPIRFNDDTYFKGGRWLLLGLEMANYELSKGKIENAEKTVNYITERYKGSYPEQEIVDPANPNTDMYDLYAANGYKPIQDLAWSYAAMVNTTVKILEHYTGKDKEPEKMLVTMIRK